MESRASTADAAWFQAITFQAAIFTKPDCAPADEVESRAAALIPDLDQGALFRRLKL
jgi:hypothetical protein